MNDWMVPAEPVDVETIQHSGSLAPDWNANPIPFTTHRPSVVDDYRRYVYGSALMATVGWISSAATQAKFGVWYDEEKIERHPVLEMLRRPNSFYSGRSMFEAMTWDCAVTGNGYIVKVRESPEDRTHSLWWAPTGQVEVTWTSQFQYVSNYSWQGATIAPEDMIHFRWQLDRENPRMGWAPARALVNELRSDVNAAAYTETILNNLAMPGVVLMPRDSFMTPDQVRELRTNYEDYLSGSGRGRPFVTGQPMELHNLIMSPQQLELRDIHRRAEARIAAAYHVPAPVVGLEVGLEHSTYSNMDKAFEAAYEQCLMRLWKNFGETLTLHLLPEFHPSGMFGRRIDYDLSEVRALQPDMDLMHARSRQNWLAGLITREEGRVEMDYSAEPEDSDTDASQKVYAIPGSVTLTPEGEAPSNVVALEDGNGGSDEDDEAQEVNEEERDASQAPLDDYGEPVRSQPSNIASRLREDARNAALS